MDVAVSDSKAAPPKRRFTAIRTFLHNLRHGGSVPALRPLDSVSQRARTAVLIGGLPEQVAREAEYHGEVDWPPLAAALDTLFMATGGSLGVRRFWISPQDSLSGRAPIEVLSHVGGSKQVEEAAYRASERAAALQAH